MMIRTIGCAMFLVLAGCAHQQSTKTNGATASMSGGDNSPSGLAESACTTDGQCKSGMSCVSGRCIGRTQDLAACMNVKVHFAYDSSEIPTEERGQLEHAAECLKSARSTKVKIEGNTDERGTEEYNMALGDRRAVSVATYLEKLGATKDQVQTVSYGKGDPICQEHDEACWQQNRRAALKPENK